ncbi:MAG TPA: FKBP-type peptidyl-prolyl cis-trans isomerase [Mucilaginibacter sp.]|jgi:FKBP-type peptidyl-prolyl cis-trans isomerase
MRKTIFTVLLLAVVCLFSCKKEENQLNIYQYDQQQIKNYIAANGLTEDMIQDTTAHDSTGIYYQILSKGTAPAVGYSDQIYFVFSLRSFDGSYTSLDTINNHYYGFVGHITSDNLPLGLQLAVKNILRNPGASARLLIPSHLAYGRNGSGSGSSQVANNKIPGNACLDYYVHTIDLSTGASKNTYGSIISPALNVYDDQVIKNYMKDSSLTGYTKTASGLYYKVLTPGTNLSDLITNSTTITADYTGQLLNGTIFDGSANGANPATIDVDGLIPGVVEGLENYATTGTKISLLIPSSLAYGASPPSSTIPPYSCLRFTFVISSITP